MLKLTHEVAGLLVILITLIFMVWPNYGRVSLSIPLVTLSSGNRSERLLVGQRDVLVVES